MAASGPQPPSATSTTSSTTSSAASSTQPLATPSTQRGLQQVWQRRSWGAWALWPLSFLYGLVVRIRRALYRLGALRSEHPGRPVVVVGNVIAGGAGKTPVVLALVRHLQARGLRVGVISRGYGRSTTDSFDFKEPTADASSEKSLAATLTTSTAIAKPPGGPPGLPGAPAGAAGPAAGALFAL